MNAPTNRLVDTIFSEAVALPRRKRERFVRRRCKGDETIERRVLALLAAADAPDERFSSPFDIAREALWRDTASVQGGDGEDLSGQRIGGWRLVQRLARGGLATVYLAHRADGSFEQKAAFKVLRRGLDTDDVVARFRAERQILSNLEHPSIAGILDGGVLADGRPYLVLEYVDGLPITRYCDDNGLDIRARVGLLVQVLDALAHAHRHLVVHRDVKPANILVGAEGHASLLDFGISKLLDPHAASGDTPLTRTGTALLTPGYASPEQYTGQPITTASDIYQVGLVAYELITGKRPFERPHQPDDADAVRPSRAMKNRRQQRQVAGDLDAIICKAMHEEPARRYGSALDMRLGLQRYLDNRPVIARPDTFAYRLAKLARRRPWLVPAMAAGALAVVGYLATLTIYNRQLEFEKQRAQSAEAFMIDLLASPDPFTPADPELGSSITVVEALAIGVERLQSETSEDSRLRASLLSSIANVYASLDQNDEAIGLAEQALALQRMHHDDASAETLDTLALLAAQHQAAGDNQAALRYRTEELATATRLHPQSHPRVGAAEAGAAALQVALGNGDQAQRLYALAVEKMRPAPAAQPHALINALVALSGLRAGPAPQEAAELLDEARVLAIRMYGEDSLSMALVHAQAATTASEHREYDRSEAAFEAALRIYDARLGPRHGATLSAMNNLGVLHIRAGNLERAERVLGELLERSEKKFGRNHRAVAGQYQNLGTVVGRQGRFAEALPLHRQAHEIFAEALPGHFMTAYPLISIAFAELQAGDPASAERAARDALELLGSAESNAYAIGVAKCLAGLALERRDRSSESAVFLAEARARLEGLSVDPVYVAACRLPKVRIDP